MIVSLDNDVGIGPRPAVGTDAGPGRAVAGGGPISLLVGNPHRQVCPVHPGVGVVKVQVPGDYALAQGQHGLHKAGYSRRRLQVAHVGLD